MSELTRTLFTPEQVRGAKTFEPLEEFTITVSSEQDAARGVLKKAGVIGAWTSAVFFAQLKTYSQLHFYEHQSNVDNPEMNMSAFWYKYQESASRYVGLNTTLAVARPLFTVERTLAFDLEKESEEFRIDPPAVPHLYAIADSHKSPRFYVSPHKDGRTVLRNLGQIIAGYNIDNPVDHDNCQAGRMVLDALQGKHDLLYEKAVSGFMTLGNNS